jgi:Flp pilus assembly protein TadD
MRLLPCIAIALLVAAPYVSHAQKKRSAPPPPAKEADGVGETSQLQDPGTQGVSEEAQALARKAMVAFGKGDLGAARKGFEKVLELAPGNAPTMINLGLIAYREKRFADAEKVLREVVRAQPEAGPAWLVLGVVYYDQDKLDDALAALAQAVLLAPKDARAHHYLGVTVGKKGWFLGAEDEMRKALELDPDYAEAHFNLAVFYLQRKPPAIELARRHYQRALDLGAAPDPQVAKGIGDPASDQ